MLRLYPLLSISLAFLLGILLGSYVSLPFGIWLALTGLALVAAVVWGLLARSFQLRPFQLSVFNQVIILVCFVALFGGGARYQYTQPRIDPFQVAWYNDRDYDILVTGTIAEPPDERDNYTNLKLQVESVDTGLDSPLEAGGLLLARVSPDEHYSYGERLRLRGKLLTPPENEEFSFRDYLARYGVHAYMPLAAVTRLPGDGGNPVLAGIYAFKERALADLYEIFPDPEASLMAGILLGVDNGIPADLQQAFKNTGTAHIIAISGFNIAIIAGIFIVLFSQLLGRRWGAVAAVSGIILYTVLVGASPSVVRAAIMGSLSIFALQIGRRQAALNTLGFVAALMALWNPLLLWDIGFQLSFAATLGLILFAEPLENLAVRLTSRWLTAEKAKKVVAPIAEFFLLTLAAQVTTLPIMAYHFGQVSLIALVANPFVLPVQPGLMVTGGLALLTSIISLPLGKLLGLVALPFPAYTIRAVEWFNGFPQGVVALGDLSLFWVVLFYVALFGIFFNWDRLKTGYPRFRGFVTPVAIIGVLAVAAIATFRSVNTAPDGKLHVTFLANGSADSVLIQSPTGRYVLINGGESISRLSDALGRRLPPDDRTLDWLVVASTQEKQVAALPRMLERFPVDNILWSGKPEASFNALKLIETLTQKDIPFTRAEAGQILELGDGATLKVLSVTPRGSVLLLEWKDFRALLPIGINFDAITELRNGGKIGEVTLLTLADSGYAPSNPPEWINLLHPRLIVLNVKAGDEDGLPDEETLKSIEGYPLLRTDRNGWIHISTDGEGMWVEAEKNK
jgi:competence protein ComEC